MLDGDGHGRVAFPKKVSVPALIVTRPGKAAMQIPTIQVAIDDIEHVGPPKAVVLRSD